MTTPSSFHEEASLDDELASFIARSCEQDPFKVESDLGYGYVKLKSSEAERRQAAQDIQCVEDAVIELLRNSRDAQASSIYIATSKEQDERTLTIIDDGSGIPEEMWGAIFEPRVTSKLDTAHMDKWGMHGRGMALYSIKENVDDVRVLSSIPDLGTSITMRVGSSLKEKTDQSSFPYFEDKDGIMAMRGPKNIVRMCCEFALECADHLKVYLGTPVQVAATLYEYGLATTPAYLRAFGQDGSVPLVKSLGLANCPEDLFDRCSKIGLDISLRTARRIMDGSIDILPDLISSMKARSFSAPSPPKRHLRTHSKSTSSPYISTEDKRDIANAALEAFAKIAPAYYLDANVEASARIKDGNLTLSIPLVDGEGKDAVGL